MKQLAMLVILLGPACHGLSLQPTANANSQITVEFVRSLLGKDHFDEKVQELREQFHDKPTATYFLAHGKCFYHIWRASGLAMNFNEDNKVDAIFLYADGVEGFKEYKGQLPAGLTFKDAKPEIYAKLKKEERLLEGGKNVRTRLEYPKQGVMIDLTLEETPHIACIVVRPIEK